MVSTKIRLIIFFVAKDGKMEKFYTVSENKTCLWLRSSALIAKFSFKLKKVRENQQVIQL